MKLGKVFGCEEEVVVKKKFIPHKSDGFPRSKIPHNYVVYYTDGSFACFQYVTGAEVKAMSYGKIPLRYERV